MPETDLAAICARFLVEDVATRPPAGSLRFSLRRFDRLMALTAEILDAGQMSDAVNYALSGTTFELGENLVIRPAGDAR